MNPLIARHARYSVVRAVCFVCGFLFIFAGAARAQLIYADSFDYPDGEIVGAAGSPWAVNYTPADGASVISGRLFLTDTNQESVRFDFPDSYSSGLLYVRMTVNFSRLPAGNGNYFAFFRYAGVDNLRGRIWASTNGAAPGTFRLGLTAISDPPQMIAKDLFLGTNYAVVCRYVISNSFCSLWIDPIGENDTSMRVDSIIDAGQWTIGHFGFLQTAYYRAGLGDYIGALTVDDLRIGRTFPEVLPQVTFTSISTAPGGGVRMQASGQATSNYVFQAATNILSNNWENLGTNAAGTDGLFNLSDPNATNFTSRFYRLLKQ